MEKRVRIHYWDNLKFVLILLVVVGHFMDIYTSESTMMKSGFLFIYSFHMPLFVFISGLFSKSTINARPFRYGKVLSYLTLYVLMKVIFWVIKVFLLHKEESFQLLTEYDVPWYMLAMAVWLCICYIVRRLPQAVVLTVSVIAALSAGYFPIIGDWLCLSRIIVFFPFFAAGYYLEPEKVKNFVCNRYVRLVGILFFVIFTVLCFWKLEVLYPFRPLLTGRNPYYKLDDYVLGGISRAGWYTVACFMSAGLMAIIPEKKVWLGQIGQKTLQIYFWHHIILYLYLWLDINALWQTICPQYWKWIYLLIAVVLTFLLSFKIFWYPTEPIMNFPWGRNRRS